MLKRLLAALVILGMLLLLPYWWPMLKESIKTVTSEVTGVAQTNQSNTQENRLRAYTDELVPQKYQRAYIFEAHYSDQTGNAFCIDGTDPEYVHIYGRISNSLWAKFEASFKKLFSQTSIRTDL